MRSSRSASIRAFALSLALLILYVTIGIIGDSGQNRNERRETLLRAANLLNTRSRDVTVSGSSLNVSPFTPAGSEASWDVFSYEISHLAARATGCTLSIVILGENLRSASREGKADVLFDGEVVRRIRFSLRNSGFYPVSRGDLVPTNIVPSAVEVVPLDRRYGFVIPLKANACAADRYVVGIRTQHVSWTISAIGLALTYTPARLPLFHSIALTEITGLVLAALLIASLILLLVRFLSLGWGPTVAATSVLILAPLTYDQWDFPLWVRFSELASFGGGNPAHAWDASPLWAFVPSIFSSITLSSYLATGNGSRTITELLLKVGMGIAYCTNAYLVAAVAPIKSRPYLAVSVLLIPAGLFVIAAGYREPFAVAIAFAGLHFAHRRNRHNLTLATVALCLAASISETLLVLVLFPAALALTYGGSLYNRVRNSIVLAALGTGLFLAEWLFLIPRDRASFALAYRFGEAPLGGASWAGAMSGLGLLPSWLPAGSATFGAGLFIALATFPAIRLVAIIRASSNSQQSAFVGVLSTYLGFLAAFFVAFRGVDPNTWYTIILMSFYYFASSDIKNPFPLLFGSIIAFAFYGVSGFGEFVNHAVFWPYDRGLLGVLGITRYIFDLMQSALAVCLIVAVSRANTQLLYSRNSPWLFLLFSAAVATTAIRFYTFDFMICVASVITLAIGLARPFIKESHPAVKRLCSTHFPRGVTKVVKTPADHAIRFGLCDTTLIFGSVGVLSLQKGSGWTAEIGWVAMALIALSAIAANLWNRFAPSEP